MGGLDESPEFYAFGTEPGTESVSFFRMTEADFRAASFLDERMLAGRSAIGRLPLSDVVAAAANLPEHCDFIFHIGHVGSTLLSRLLGSHPAVLSIREPFSLRQMAQTEAKGARTDTFLKLLSRTFRPGQRSLIKATSFVSEIAPSLMARPSQPTAIGIFAPPPVYLATILAGQNARREAQTYLPTRYKRLARRADAELPPVLSEGEGIALGWACEMSALARAGDRMLWLEFDHFLEQPRAVLTAAFRHLNIDVSSADVTAIATGPDMQRYSKAPEYPYDAQLRRAILQTANQQHAIEIKRGLAWLDRATYLQCVKDALEIRGNC